MKKILLSFATVALTVASAANSYRVTLFQPAIVNGTELKPGDYKVTLKENKAVLTSGKKSVEANVRQETADSKFSSTTVRYTDEAGKYRVQEIRIGGTNTRLVFEN
jgi:subtilase family serine protease